MNELSQAFMKDYECLLMFTNIYLVIMNKMNLHEPILNDRYELSD